MVCCCLIVIGSFIAGLVAGIQNANDDDEIDSTFNFDGAEFNIFEFFALCSELENTGVFLEDDVFDGTETLIGIQTCLSGHRVTCEVIDFNLAFANHCPTVLDSDCVCDEGSINFITSESPDFGCDIGLGAEEEAYVEQIYDVGECDLLEDEFDAVAVLADANLDDFTGSNLEESVRVLNELIQQCTNQQVVLEVVNGQGPGDDEQELFNACVNGNVELVCLELTTDFNFGPCNTPPGEIINN